jgi:hypothetical protein
MTADVSSCHARSIRLKLTDPSPTLVTTHTIHLRDGGGQETTKRTGKRSSGEKESSTETKFIALVPASATRLALLALKTWQTHER